VTGAEHPPADAQRAGTSVEPASGGERDDRMGPAIEAARRQAEERATAEILALEEDIEKEREHAVRSLEEIQHRLEEAEARAAGNFTVTDARTEEGLDAQLRRLQAESDAEITAALAKVRADTQGRMEREAKRRLAEQEEALRAEAEERVRITGETVRKETEGKFARELHTLRTQLEEERSSRDQLIQKAENRAERAEANVEDMENARLDAEAEVRSAAAEWVRSRTRALQRDAERGAKEKIATARRETTEKVTEGRRVGFLGRAAESRRAKRAAGAAEGDRRVESKRDEEAGRAESKRQEETGRAEQEAKQKAADQAEAVKAERAAKAKQAAEEKQTREQEAASKAKPTDSRRRGGLLDVNEANFEELRELGMSVTQATRVIAYRERREGFDSVDDLETVPGIDKDFLSGIEGQLTA
jgi:DNA uptake protein ComE-like DNA-binding protein